MSPPSVAVLLGSTVQGRFLVNQPPVSACPRTHASPGFPFTFCALKPKPTSGTPHRAHVCAKSRRAQAQGCADLPCAQSLLAGGRGLPGCPWLGDRWCCPLTTGALPRSRHVTGHPGFFSSGHARRTLRFWQLQEFFLHSQSSLSDEGERWAHSSRVSSPKSMSCVAGGCKPVALWPQVAYKFEKDKKPKLVSNI